MASRAAAASVRVDDVTHDVVRRGGRGDVHAHLGLRARPLQVHTEAMRRGRRARRRTWATSTSS